MKEYEELLSKYKEYAILGSISGVLGWDMEVYMPKNGMELRSEQQGLLSGMIHERKTTPRIGELLSILESSKTLDEIQKRNILLIRLEYDRSTKLPKEFVEEWTKHGNLAYQSWVKAKNEKNYSLFKDDLEKGMDFARKAAEYINPNKDPYNVMLDFFDYNMTYEEISVIFNELKPKLITLIKNINNSKIEIDSSKLHTKISIEKQKKLGEDVLDILHFDKASGRLDETEHPFTGGYINDVRLTTKYFENDFSNGLFSTMHEAGHGLYDQNLPKEFYFQPISDPASASIHESQSRLVENIIGRSYHFWEFYFPKLNEIFDGELNIDLDEFYRAMNKVRLSKIRIEADEVTYCLHIILRFELERELIDGKINFDDLPKIWNEKIKDYFGLDIDNDAEGVLQDVHWSGGLLGYFPSYALGNILSGQLLHAMKKDLDFEALLRSGDVHKIISWLSEKVHILGGKFDLNDLCKEVTGEELTSKYYINYLTDKYSKIYNL